VTRDAWSGSRPTISPYTVILMLGLDGGRGRTVPKSCPAWYNRSPEGGDGKVPETGLSMGDLDANSSSRDFAGMALCRFWLPTGRALPASLRIKDGDTIVVMHDKQADRTSAWKPSTARSSRPSIGQKAKQAHVATLIFGKTVTIQPTGTTGTGGTLANVLLPDGRSLNHGTCATGYALGRFRKYSKDQTLAKLEADARQNRRGLWADPNPAAPWDWRDQQRGPAKQPLAESPRRSPTASRSRRCCRILTARTKATSRSRSERHRPVVDLAGCERCWTAPGTSSSLRAKSPSAGR